MLKRLLLSVLFAFCLLAVSAQNSITEQYLSIRDKLMIMKANSELVTEQLKELSRDLKLSQEEAKQWETTSMTLSENLMNINEQLNNAYETLEKEQQKNKQLRKSLTCLISIFVGLTLVALIVLYLELTKKTDFI